MLAVQSEQQASWAWPSLNFSRLGPSCLTLGWRLLVWSASRCSLWGLGPCTWSVWPPPSQAWWSAPASAWWSCLISPSVRARASAVSACSWPIGDFHGGRDSYTFQLYLHTDTSVALVQQSTNRISPMDSKLGVRASLQQDMSTCTWAWFTWYRPFVQKH